MENRNRAESNVSVWPTALIVSLHSFIATEPQKPLKDAGHVHGCRATPSSPRGQTPHGGASGGNHKNPRRPPARAGRRQLQYFFRTGVHPRIRANLLDSA